MTSRGIQIEQLLPIRRSLVHAVLGDERKVRAPRIQRCYSGPKERGRGGRAPLCSDDVALEIRRLKEQCGMTIAQIVEHLRAHGLELPPTYIRSLLTYQTRSHLVPTEGAASYIQKANA